MFGLGLGSRSRVLKQGSRRVSDFTIRHLYEDNLYTSLDRGLFSALWSGFVTMGFSYYVKHTKVMSVIQTELFCILIDGIDGNSSSNVCLVVTVVSKVMDR